MNTASTSSRPRVVVVGTGHGGLEAVHALRKAPVDVLLVDRNNYHKFQPLLYQVATAGLQPGDITQPARHLFHRQANVAFRMARVVGVDFTERKVLVEDGTPIPYDYLVLAAGASTAFFGVAGAAQYTFPLKNVSDAINLRSHVIGRFEAVDRDPTLVDEGALTFVVVGGGATGVETAGALVELFDRVFKRDFPRLQIDRARVVLVEMGDGLLAGFRPELRAYARRVLERRGVQIRLEEAVAEVTPREVRLRTGETLRAHTTIWAAGVRANPLSGILGVAQTVGGRVVVDDTLRLPGHAEVFVVGDMAGATDRNGALYPQVGQVAIQQGRHAARTIRRLLEGAPPETFRYRDLGMLATIGRNAAVAQFPGGLTLTGRPAWVVWALVHIAKLVGFRNRLSVMLNWAYNYFTWDRGPRLLLSTFPETDEVPPVEPALSNFEAERSG